MYACMRLGIGIGIGGDKNRSWLFCLGHKNNRCNCELCYPNVCRQCKKVGSVIIIVISCLQALWRRIKMMHGLDMQHWASNGFL